MGSIPTCKIVNHEKPDEGELVINQNDWKRIWEPKGYELVEMAEEDFADPTKAGDSEPSGDVSINWDKYSDDDIKAFAVDSDMDPNLPRVGLVAMLEEIKYNPEAVE